MAYIEVTDPFHNPLGCLKDIILLSLVLPIGSGVIALVIWLVANGIKSIYDYFSEASVMTIIIWGIVIISIIIAIAIFRSKKKEEVTFDEVNKEEMKKQVKK